MAEELRIEWLGDPTEHYKKKIVTAGRLDSQLNTKQHPNTRFGVA
jgi:hypothetical protein